MSDPCVTERCTKPASFPGVADGKKVFVCDDCAQGLPPESADSDVRSTTKPPELAQVAHGLPPSPARSWSRLVSPTVDLSPNVGEEEDNNADEDLRSTPELLAAAKRQGIRVPRGIEKKDLEGMVHVGWLRVTSVLRELGKLILPFIREALQTAAKETRLNLLLDEGLEEKFCVEL